MVVSVCDWDDLLVADPFVSMIDQLTGMVSFQDVDECSDELIDDLDDIDENKNTQSTTSMIIISTILIRLLSSLHYYCLSASKYLSR